VYKKRGQVNVTQKKIETSHWMDSSIIVGLSAGYIDGLGTGGFNQ
jgi:hypothetical protein